MKKHHKGAIFCGPAANVSLLPTHGPLLF